jgi:hypothetical protein
VPLSPEKIARCAEALIALKALRENYSDVLVVLDFVTLTDVAKFQADSDENGPAGETLTEKELESVLWRLGKHVGCSETSNDLLPSVVQFALDEHTRRELE